MGVQRNVLFVLKWDMARQCYSKKKKFSHHVDDVESPEQGVFPEGNEDNWSLSINQTETWVTVNPISYVSDKNVKFSFDSVCNVSSLEGAGFLSSLVTSLQKTSMALKLPNGEEKDIQEKLNVKYL